MQVVLNFSILKHNDSSSIIKVKYGGDLEFLKNREETYGPVPKCDSHQFIEDLENKIKDSISKAVEGVFEVEA